MYRDNETVALNSVLVQCEMNARHFRHTADLLESEADGRLLRQVADERADFAEQLRREMKRHGELGDTADTESDTFHELGETVVSGLGAWGRDELLQARFKDEEQLTECVANTLALSIPDEYRPLLQRIGSQSRADAGRLRAMIDSP